MNEQSGDRDVLFGVLEFLAEARKIRTKPAYTYEALAKGDGWSRFVTSIPEHENISVLLGGNREDPSQEVLLVRRTEPPPEPPDPPIEFSRWVGGDFKNPDCELTVLEYLDDDDGTLIPEDGRLALAKWLDDWRPWAEEAARTTAARTFYEELFDINNAIESEGGQLELLMCVGLIEGRFGANQVKRHLAVAPLEVEFRAKNNGEIAVVFAGSCQVEDDFVDTTALGDAAAYLETKKDVGAFDGERIADRAVIDHIRSLASQLSPRTMLVEERVTPTGDSIHVSASPMLLLRRRRSRKMIDFLEAAKLDIESSPEIPAGLRSLIDIQAGASVREHVDHESGAMLDVGGEELLASLPLNDAQLKVVRSATERPQTVVQGPPGTGKTHTSAALITHLLAMGKRVLITAETDQALVEIRNKLPVEVRDLAVASIGKSQRQLEELASSVQVINYNIENFDPDLADQREVQVLSKLDQLRRERQALISSQLAERRFQTEPVELLGISRTPAGHAQWLTQNESDGWLLDDPPSIDAPLDDYQFRGLVEILNDGDIRALVEEAQSAAETPLCSVEEFRELVGVESRASVRQNAVRAGQLEAPNELERELLSLADQLDQIPLGIDHPLVQEAYEKGTLDQVRARRIEEGAG